MTHSLRVGYLKYPSVRTGPIFVTRLTFCDPRHKLAILVDIQAPNVESLTMSKKRRVKQQGTSKVALCDPNGKPLDVDPPTPLTGTFCRMVRFVGDARVGDYDDDGQTGDQIRSKLLRAQVPYVVSLLVYHSKLQLEPTVREYFVYAPMEVTKAAKLAMRLWQRWERPPRPEFNLGDLREQFPKVDDAIVAEPIDDAFFLEHWEDVKQRKHLAAGHPDDPFAFTCLDQDVRIFKTGDIQAGLDFRI